VHRRSAGTAFRALTLALIASVATTAMADVANPYDKFRNATYSNKGLASEQDELRLGSEVHRQVLAKFRMVQDPELVGYVERVGQRVASVSKRPNLQFQFFVVDDQSVNAFSIPGGFVYVNTGLLDMVQSEDELAAVLAHEIGHVVARHGLRNYKKAQRTSLWTGILGTAAVIASGMTLQPQGTSLRVWCGFSSASRRIRAARRVRSAGYLPTTRTRASESGTRRSRSSSISEARRCSRVRRQGRGGWASPRRAENSSL
jgi:predicted Zn-dependent protease